MHPFRRGSTLDTSAVEHRLRQAGLGGDRPADAESAERIRRIAAFLRALPDDLRAGAEEDAIARLADPGASDRKVEKELRKRALGFRFDERASAIRDAAPDLMIERADQSWALRVRRMRSVRIAVGDHSSEVILEADHYGVPLELRFLDPDTEHFVRLARRVLECRLDAREREVRGATERLRSFVKERADRPFYDTRELSRLVAREIQMDEDPTGLPRRVGKAARRLDFQAREKERVRRAIHDQGLLVYRNLFPVARRMGRRITFYCGPTNSGKTWHALNRLVEAGSGAYLAPLRLLALEGQEELETRGVVASFLTGEERDLREGAAFIASTIEMLDPEATYDAVVIDEIQMLGDPDRGWAWCQAMVGAAGREVILTGSPDAIPLVEALARYLDEPLEIVRVERLTELRALDRPVPPQKIRPGTAVVAFSRREILRLKGELERRYRVAVVYGNLTPEVRREEARRFRSGEAEVLVSTDAIAMGLNLPIETVLFAATSKFDGVGVRPLTDQELLQIGGRAGRYGKYPSGFVGTLPGGDLDRIREVLAPGFKPPTLPLRAAVRPAGDHVDALAAGLETTSLGRVLAAFRRAMHFDTELLTPGVTDDMETLASHVDRHPEVPLERRLMLSCAPVDTNSEWLLATYAEWLEHVADGRSVRLGRLPAWAEDVARGDQQLQAAESEAKRLMIYSWLAFRLPGIFPDLDLCQEQRSTLDGFIERSLARRIPDPGAGRGERRGGGGGRRRGGRRRS